MTQFNKYLERLWLIIAIASAVFAAYQVTTLGWDEGSSFLIIPVIAGAWYGARRYMRIRMERVMEEQQNKQ